MKKILFFLLVSLLGFLFFQNKKPTTLTYNFYYWKQNYKPSSQKKYFPKYVKVLDIYYNKRAVIQTTKFNAKVQQDIVPVIYVDNSIFYHLNALDLIKKVYPQLKKIAQTNFSYHEIQIDCDWTLKTKKRYFNFLKELKKLSKKELSSTIRLHQVKYYHRTGVPPVDRGILMYYNMSDFKDLNTKNYILDLDIAKKYHKNFKNYPLPLDLALPLYAQATLIRFEKVVGILEGLRKKDLNKNFKEVKKNHYLVTKTHYFKGRLLYDEDILRLDAVSPEALKKAVKNLKKIMKKPHEILFYRWGNRNFYKEQDLKEICSW